jgi:hypothetical protein
VQRASGFDRPVEHDTSASNCNTQDFVVETNNNRGEEGNPDHTIRPIKPINDINKIDDIIKYPDEIFEYANKRYLFKTFADGVAVIVVGQRHGGAYELITQLTDDGGLWDSLSSAKDDIKNDEENGKEPNKQIDC